MTKVNVKIDIEELKEALVSLSETDLGRLIKETKKSKLKARLKTINMEEFEGLKGIMSVGGNAVRDTERYYE